jgi:hypothetical protein
MSPRYNSISRIFLISALTCAIFVRGTETQASVSNSRSSALNQNNASVSTLASSSHKGGRLIVQRAPNFGTDLVVHLSIDGKDVANIQRDHRYDGFVSAGRHVLTVLAVPNSQFRPPTSTRLTVQPGRTYAFTAVWESDRVVLRRSSLFSDATQAPSVRIPTR